MYERSAAHFFNGQLQFIHVSCLVTSTKVVVTQRQDSIRPCRAHAVLSLCYNYMYYIHTTYVHVQCMHTIHVHVHVCTFVGCCLATRGVRGLLWAKGWVWLTESWPVGLLGNSQQNLHYLNWGCIRPCSSCIPIR